MPLNAYIATYCYINTNDILKRKICPRNNPECSIKCIINIQN